MPMPNLLEFLHQRLSKPILPEPQGGTRPAPSGRPIGIDRVA
jgi:hypothetical protein